jgi:hypothetical protein
MSNRDVVEALDEIERILQEEDLTANTLASWRERFDGAMASAERGPGWVEIADRAHRLGKQADQLISRLSKERDAMKKELGMQAVGSRALKGYKPS